MAHSGGTEDTAGVETFADVAAMDAWLTAHAGLGAGVWVKVAKKGTGLVSVGAADVNDVALCHGWITGHRKGYDDAWFLQRITPRRPGSMWSAVNVRRVEELTAAGRMRPAGHAEVAAARADGRWAAAYASQKEATVPDDLAAALAEHPRALSFFDGLGRTDRYRAVVGLLRARSPETREARLRAVIAELEAGRRPK
ncbi:YdeI family protein [Streptomyces sp. NPDC060011]|uniref:YdeI/OmpD-associated family protein n=1 Tax=unclassified Streptomyces TaxID=2593676 RepID=UPI0013BE69F9|nr:MULTISPECIES: YdeI/OmpD-associated family protein [unclassified Streptomyces]MCX5130648.1 YdeI/OmpD-associated family protein [Streptomyces sp. NBC_00340]NEB33172.1 OmdA domain containing protein [Streptomyces sp. SID14446]WSK60970.1 YdeI/OmpD-associated family protein [Streptomyces sp. NBC_01281]